jgi:fructose transport system permease protein
MTTLKDKLPPLGQLGPFIALLIACVFFGTTTDRSSAARTSR